jgi:hypothetical protein
MWLSQVRVSRQDMGIRLDASGYTRIASKQITLAQIQEYVNALKGMLTEIHSRLEKAGLAAGNKKTKSVLTTSRREVQGAEVMQFDASFTQTAGP